MKKNTHFVQLRIFLLSLFLTSSLCLSAQVGIGTTTPSWQFQMVNSGNIGAATMAEYRNTGIDGVSLSSYNTSTTSGYNGYEGITNYNGTGFITSAIFGLSITGGTTGNPNNWHNGIGVRGFSNSNNGVGVRGGFVGGTTLQPGWAIYGNGWAGGLTAWLNVSDRRLKSNIETIDGALNKLLRLRGVEYNFDKTNYPDVNFDTTTKQIGFIAQEVEEVFPNLVKESYMYSSPDEVNPHEQIEGNQYLVKTLAYSNIVPITVEAIKEQQEIIQNQNKKIELLEKRLAQLESKIQALTEKNE